MKKLFTLLFGLSLAFTASAQAPTVEGTYLPVAGTTIHQIYDTTAVALTTPSFGANQVWDYSNAFVNLTDTFWIETFYAANTPYAALFPDATHATFLRTCFFDGDSLYTYLKIDTMGVHAVGGYSIQSQFNAPFESTDWEYIMPNEVSMGTVITDTSDATAYGQYLGLDVKIHQVIYKELEAVGYGTCTTPIGTFNDVLLGRETRSRTDSIFVDILGNGNYVFTQAITPNPSISDEYRYHFLRNNTFGSTHIMQLKSDLAGNMGWGWYTLPVAIGTISGNVLDDQGAAVTNGEVLLYRENSNFAKNDILDRATLDAAGYYEFDSIPYGEYRVAARADIASYPNSLTTYAGDTTNWIDCQSIMLTGATAVAPAINLRYNQPLAGQGTASGVVLLNLGYTKNNDPIPGLDIVVERNPGGQAADGGITDFGGEFTFTDLDDGDYTINVEIPGLHMAGSYDFSITGGTVEDQLDFVVSLDSIYPTGEVLSVPQYTSSVATVEAYPNPFDNITTISYTTNVRADVQLEVVNLLGEHILSIDRGTQKAGTHRIEFNAADAGFSSGIYLVTLTVNGVPHSLKLVQQ